MPPRDWRRYWHSYAGHFLLGVFAGVLIITGWQGAASSFLIAYIAYQGFSWLRKRDTPGRDVGDFMAGLIPAVVTGWIYLEAWPAIQGVI